MDEGVGAYAGETPPPATFVLRRKFLWKSPFERNVAFKFLPELIIHDRAVLVELLQGFKLSTS